MRDYKIFTYKDSKFRISSTRVDMIEKSIVRVRTDIEDYIRVHPEFLSSLVPIALSDEAPHIACEMARAAGLAGVGPMAAVAGAIAEAAAREAVREGAREAIVENGGDIFLVSEEEAVVGLFAGSGSLKSSLALVVEPAYMPVSICSSSSFMGHSLSFGKCDLATVVAESGALADAVVTFACNSVKDTADIEPTLDKVMSIEGVRGVILVKADKIGLAGDLPRIVRNADERLEWKVTRSNSQFEFLARNESK
jgi:ApbE superfamily uncharacterized protein (UPF0280 family)